MTTEQATQLLSAIETAFALPETTESIVFQSAIKVLSRMNYQTALDVFTDNALTGKKVKSIFEALGIFKEIYLKHFDRLPENSTPKIAYHVRPVEEVPTIWNLLPHISQEARAFCLWSMLIHYKALDVDPEEGELYGQKRLFKKLKADIAVYIGKNRTIDVQDAVEKINLLVKKYETT